MSKPRANRAVETGRGVRLALASVLVAWWSSCLPSSDDLGEYSASWSEPGAAVESAQQTAFPSPSGSAAAPSGQGSGAANTEGPPAAIPPAQGMTGPAEIPASEDPPAPSPAPALPTPAEQCAEGVLDATATSCYRVASSPATWQAARAECVSWGGALAKVESTEEDQLIAQLVSQDLWLGGSDTVTENVFVWTDGSAILFGNWGPAQPDRFPGPDCVQKRATAGRMWFDQPCDNAWLYVCEKPVD